MKMIDLVFFRKGSFYTVPCPALPGHTLEDIAKDNAEVNPGTLRVEDMKGNVLWTSLTAREEKNT